MKKNPLLFRLIIFFAGLAVLFALYFTNLPKETASFSFDFHWNIILMTYLAIFIPYFAALAFPENVRKGKPLRLFLIISQIVLTGASAAVIYLNHRHLLTQTILYIIFGGFAFVYAVNVAFSFMASKHSASAQKIQPVQKKESSWLISVQAQLDSIIKKAEKLGDKNSNLKERMIKAKADIKNFTPVNDATALKSEHQIMDSIIDVINTMDQKLAGNNVNLEAKVSSLENHIHQRQNLTLY